MPGNIDSAVQASPIGLLYSVSLGAVLALVLRHIFAAARYAFNCSAW